MRWIRPRGESVSCPHKRYVGHVGRQKPQCTQSSRRSRPGAAECVELTNSDYIPRFGTIELSLLHETYIEARRLARAYIDVDGKRLVAGLLDTDAMRSLRELNDKTILALRAAPRLTIDVNGRVAGLHAH